MSVFVNAQGIKTVHTGRGVKKWQNSVHVVVACPLMQLRQHYEMQTGNAITKHFMYLVAMSKKLYRFAFQLSSNSHDFKHKVLKSLKNQKLLLFMSHVTIKLLDDIDRQVFFVGQHCNLGYFNSLGIFYAKGQ